MDNIKEQADEIEALVSIYNNEWKFQPEIESYSIEVKRDVKLYVKLNENYPSMAPPSFELLAPTLNREQRQCIENALNNIYEDNKGGPILFQWIEKLKEIISNLSDNKVVLSHSVASEENNEEKPENLARNFRLNVTHGPVIVDRKSSFQGHCCAVSSTEDIKMFMDYLLDNKKIAQATHNILAYRIFGPNGILQDCDDDGENHAGGRVLHLLQILNLSNVAVVVTRWYGGIHLGPDRFKHINNAARQVLLDGNFIKP